MKNKTHALKQAVIVASIGAAGAVLGAGLSAVIQASFKAETRKVQGGYSDQRKQNEKVMSESIAAIFAAMAKSADSEIAQGTLTAQKCKKASPAIAQEAQDQLTAAQKGVDAFKSRDALIAASFTDLLTKQGKFEELVEANKLHEAIPVLQTSKETSAHLRDSVGAQVEQLDRFINLSNQLNRLSTLCG